MRACYLRTTRTMTGRLGLFFGGMSIAIGIFCYFLIAGVLHWSEDRVTERRLEIDVQEAMTYFHQHPEQSVFHLDPFTTAYNDLSFLPEDFHPHLDHELPYNTDVHLEDIDGYDSLLFYHNQYTYQGKIYPIVLTSVIDHIEINDHEFVIVVTSLLLLVMLLISIFGLVLWRISKGLIEPLTMLSEQLYQAQGDVSKPFQVTTEALDEFQQLTQQINHYRQQVQQTLKREQAFARYASHELRTPLTVMQGSSNLLKRQTTDNPFIQRQVARIEETCKQMTTMVDALLGLVRYERNQQDAEFRLLTENEIRKIMQDNQAQAHSKGLSLDLEFVGSAEISATPAIIALLLGNLLRNAIAATAFGEIKVICEPQQLQVIDQGIGLTEHYNEQGHGLGLLIIDDLCQRYGWRFELNNNDRSDGCVAVIFFH